MQAQVAITGGAILSNSAEFGGGLYLSQFATVTVSADGAPAIFSGNTATHAGGGIYNGGGALTITNAALDDNSAFSNGAVTTFGGGIDSVLGVATLTNASLMRNSADYGGGLYNSHGMLTITGVTVTGNSAFAQGGGLANESGSVTVSQSTLFSNTAQNGGAIETLGGNATLLNTTLSDNSASAAGGGIDHFNGVVALTNVTLSGNSAFLGAGGLNERSGSGLETGFTTLSNTILLAAGAGGGNCLQELPFIYIISSGYNLSSDETCVIPLIHTGDLNNADPHLGPLANYGGPTLTRLPRAGSPGIDAIPAGTNGCGTTLFADQRGAPRPINGKCDLGAVEAGWIYPQLWLPLVRR